MLSALLLLGVFFLTGCNQNASSQHANNTKKPANSENTSIAQSTPEEAKRISQVDAKTGYDAGSVVIVDTRDADSYAQEHIKGAINIPLPEFENRYQELPKDKQIIIYCS
jgi:3-mercaptopyruvate sulfurtransferase SseA